MFSYLYNLLRSFQYFLIVNQNIRKQKRYLDEKIYPILEMAKSINDGTIDEEDIKKIKLYGMAIPAVLGEAYCTYRDLPMNETERLSMTCIGGITGLFDDLFDRKNLSQEYIKHLLDFPEENNTNNSNEKLLVKLYQLGLENSDKHDLIKKYAQQVYEAQIASLKQLQPNLSIREIEEITFDKGGFSMLLYRCGLAGEMDANDYELLFNLGAIGQFENDIFDTYKDAQEGIKTFSTVLTSVAEVRERYKNKILIIFQLIEKSSYPSPQKARFKHFTALVVCSALVCLDQFNKISQRTNGKFKVNEYSRKELICDMQNPLKILKTLHYAAIYAKI